MLELGDYITSGGERDVYRHPLHPDRIIKLRRNNAELDRNLIEYNYFRTHPGILQAPIPKLYGWIETTRGRGLEYELIADESGNPCKTLPNAVLAGLLSAGKATELLDKFFTDAYNSVFYIYEANPNNLLYRPQNSELIVVDGFGPSRWNIKYRLRSYSSYLQRRKIRKSHKLIMTRWNKWLAIHGLVQMEETAAAGSDPAGPGGAVGQIA